MIIKNKLQAEKVVKFISGGEIKEVLARQDLFNPEDQKIEIYFRGKRCSGIIELSKSEARDLQKTLVKELKFSNVKVFR